MSWQGLLSGWQRTRNCSELHPTRVAVRNLHRGCACQCQDAGCPRPFELEQYRNLRGRALARNWKQWTPRGVGSFGPPVGQGPHACASEKKKPSRLSSASRQTETCWHRGSSQTLTAHISVRLCRRSLLDSPIAKGPYACAIERGWFCLCCARF